MADNLIFPIGFDLEAGVKQAEKNADKYLRQLENAIKSRPIKLDVAINAGDGSISAIQKEMDSLVKEFNKLSEAQRVFNRTSGEYTPEAQKLIAKYAELTAATQTYAQSLQQITAAARKQTDEQLKEQQRELKAYEDYWKRKEAESAKQAQADIAAGDRQRKAQQQRIAQEQAADAKRYQEWLRQKNQEAVETERVERQKQQSRERTIAQQNRELAEERRLQQQRQEAISASLRAEYQRIEAKRQAEAASKRELQMLNQQYAAEERRQKLAEQEARIKGLQKLRGVLQAEENTIANINAKLQLHQQRLQQAEVGGRAWRKSAEEVKRLTAELNKANQKMRELTGQTTSGAEKQASAVRQVSKEYKHRDGYVSRLIKRLAVYASFSAVNNFLTSVREVTAQFELQRVSLGAILQDQTRANALFSEIKQFALKSPVSILDLTKYTKQLAAYKIGVDELFETTKKLTDVSVGLGVSLDRVILAYGQVRARGALYSSEIRQFTEMGVPIVEELAAKLSKANGELVTSAQVLKLVEKGAISFELVKEVFDDMTSAGGMFYNMQEKQGNTLFGLWAKLGDAVSMMYDEIGNTEGVNSGMKSLIERLTDLMKNWRLVGRELLVFGAATAIIVAKSKAHAATTALQAAALNKVRNAGIAYNAILAEEASLLKVGTAAQLQSIAARKANAKAALDAAISERAAASSTGLWARAMQKLKGAFLGNWITLAITAIAAIGAAIYSAYEKSHKLQNDLKDIESAGATEATKSAYHFEQLAEKAVKAADGSMEQKDALDELQRTYKDMIPIQDLSIEKLKDLKGNYDSLTQSIKEYVYQRNLQQQVDRIIEERTATITRLERRLREELKNGVNYQVSDAVHTKDLGIDDDQISTLFSRIKTEAQHTTKDVETIVRESVDEIFGYLSQEDRNILYYIGYNKSAGETDGYKNSLQSLIELQRTMDSEIENTSTSMSQYTGYLGDYKDELDEITESVQKYRLINTKGEAVDRDTFLFKQGQNNYQIKRWAESIKRGLEQAGVTVQEGIFNLVERIDESAPTKISTIDFTKLLPMLDTPEVKQKLGNSHETFKSYILSIQKLYEGYIPSDPIVKAVRNRMFAIGNATKGGMDVMKRYLWDGKSSIEDHLKSLKESSKTLQAELYKYANYIKQYGVLGKAALFLRGIDVDALTEEFNALTKQIQYVQTYVQESGSGRAKSDPRLQILNEMVQLAEKLNKEYSDWEKKVGGTKALEKVNDTYKETVKYAEQVAKKAGIKLPHLETPTNAKELNEYLDAVRRVMETAKGLKGGKKAAIELEVKMSDNISAEDQKAIEEKIKALADRISRTKTAREFYEKILRLTRNEDLAFSATFSVFGQDKLDTFAEEVEQLKENFGEIDITAAINLKTKQIDYKALRGMWEVDKALPDNLRKIPSAYDSTIKSILDAGDKLSEKQFERWGKDLERAREYADKRIELAEYTATQIAEIETKRDSLNPDEKNYKAQVAMYNEMIRGYREREKNEAAKLDYEQVKEQIGMFDDLGVRIGTAFENILQQLRDYTQSPDFARLSLEAQKNVYQQIAKIEDRMAEGFQGIGVGTVSEYVRQYSAAASEYLTAQNNLREATLKAIDADKEWARVKNSNNEAAKSAALAEKNLADSRVRTAAASVNTAGAKLQATQDSASRASAKFDKNLQKVESSIRSLNNGALGALWDLLGDKGKRSVGEFLSGSYKMVSAINKLTKAVTESGSDMGALSKTIVENLANALQGIDPKDTEEITKATKEALKTTFSGVISDKDVVESLAGTFAKNFREIVSQVMSGVLSTEQATKKVGAMIDSVADAASSTGEMWGAIISLVLSLLDEFAENGLGKFIGELLDDIANAVEGILANLLTDTLPKILAGAGNVIKGVGTGLGDLLTFGIFDLTGSKRIKRANKEIERQKELIEQLEYSYKRLEEASDKLFGRDYISNYNAQIRNLQAQQTAYLKQAEAERSKGKKADEDKIKEYENSARDAADEIKKLQDDLTAHFVGSDRAGLAREFARSWLEAKASFASTTDAIKSKYKDMIQSMIVEGAAAKVIDAILAPMWDQMDKMLGENDITGAIDYLVNGMDQFVADADNGMNVLWKSLEAKGYDMKKLLGDTGGEYTGISRDVASASEESINGLAAGINTQNYYISHVPNIAENVAVIRALMEGGHTTSIPTATAGWTDWQQQAMDSYVAIQRNTADAVVECRRIAVACEEEVAQLRRVIVPRGTKGSHGVQVYM